MDLLSAGSLMRCLPAPYHWTEHVSPCRAGAVLGGDRTTYTVTLFKRGSPYP